MTLTKEQRYELYEKTHITLLCNKHEYKGRVQSIININLWIKKSIKEE